MVHNAALSAEGLEAFDTVLLNDVDLLLSGENIG